MCGYAPLFREEVKIMEMQVREMEPQERNYSYSQNSQIIGQTGCIGHLRADMGSNGLGFYSSWDDHYKELKVQEFKDELDEVINSFRFSEEYGGFLRDRNSLSHYCYGNLRHAFGMGEREYGVRADTKKYTYMMRLNPNAGEYNLYCYCYRKEWLDRHLEHAGEGIRFISPDYEEKFRIEDGEKIRIVRDGEQRDVVCRYIDGYHTLVGNSLYHICEFAECMERTGAKVIPLRDSLPETCYSILPSSGELISVRKGETGYWAPDTVPEGVSPREYADRENRRLGVDRAQEADMLAGSMFGWHVPAADPGRYDREGNPVKTKRPEKSRAR